MDKGHFMMTEIEHLFSDSVYSLPELDCTEVIEAFFGNESLKGKRVLDAGCRHGEYTNAFKKIGAIPYGIDINASCIEYAKCKYPALENHFICGDICSLSNIDANYFDIIYCVGTMPYLNQSQALKAIKEFQRITKPGGKILLVFQTNKSLLFLLVTKLFNLIPLYIYMKTIVPFLSILMFPFAPLLLGRKVSLSYLKYGVFVSLRSIHYGSPEMLSHYQIKTPNFRGFSAKCNESYLISVGNKR